MDPHERIVGIQDLSRDRVVISTVITRAVSNSDEGEAWLYGAEIVTEFIFLRDDVPETFSQELLDRLL